MEPNWKDLIMIRESENENKKQKTENRKQRTKNRKKNEKYKIKI